MDKFFTRIKPLEVGDLVALTRMLSGEVIDQWLVIRMVTTKNSSACGRRLCNRWISILNLTGQRFRAAQRTPLGKVQRVYFRFGMFGSFDIWPNETVYVERQKRVEPVWLTEKLIKIVIQHRSPEDLLPLMMRLRSLCDIPLLLKQLQAKGLNNVAERYAREGVSTPP